MVALGPRSGRPSRPGKGPEPDSSSRPVPRNILRMDWVPSRMARLSLEGLPRQAWLGGPIEGTLVLETDRPLRAADFDLRLRGRELSQETVYSGRSTSTIEEESTFLDTVTSFRENVPFSDPEHIAPGTYRLPFRFELPATAEPSLATDDADTVRGRFFHHPDGMFVEYEFEARVHVPWWVDPIDRVTVPVLPRARSLGSFPPLASAPSVDHPSFRINFDAGEVLPGSTVSGAYVIENPKGKHLDHLTIRLFRHIAYRVQDKSLSFDGPEYNIAITIDKRDSLHTGRFQIPTFDTTDDTPPYQGNLYRAYWMVHAELEVEFGFNVKVEVALTPPSPPLPESAPLRDASG